MSGSSQLRRIARHVSWVKAQGISRLIEEDELNPLTNARLAVRRGAWRRSNPVAPGSAMPVLVFGVQRSGTNMVTRGFRSSPAFEVFNENDKRAFVDFRLRPLDEVAALVSGSRHRWVLLKPLCDSHRAAELLEALSGTAPARAMWVHRQVDSRVRSAVAKFGDANLQALRAIGAGKGDGLWQAGGLSQDNLRLIQSFDLDAMSPVSASALFWFIRNSLFFELGLYRRNDVLAVSYDRLVRAPEEVTRQICDFLGCPWDKGFSAHIQRRESSDAAPLGIDPTIRDHCNRLQERFDAMYRRESSRAGEAPPG